MSLFSRIRDVFRSPADRRLEAAAWESAPRPSSALALRAGPFGGGPLTPDRAPSIDWLNDQPAPAPPYVYRGGYSDHTYRNLSAPLNFEGFDLERIHRAVAQHRLGYFYESSALMVAILGFAPALAALQQAIAPILSLRRHIHGGDKGLSRMVAAEVEDALVPQASLLPSPFLPPELWGTMAIYLRVMGFCVLQHVDGDPDPETGVRPRYTRVWEPWAVMLTRSPRKRIAMTTEGPKEILNDGHFTWLADENEGHLSGAIVAVGDDVLGGKLTQSARQDWLDFFGKPKLYATLPQKIPTTGEAGDAFEAALNTIYGPDGRGVLPFGSTLQAVQLTGEGSKAFHDALMDFILHIAMVFIGSDGTLSKGSGGVYTAPIYEGVRRDLIARPTACIVRGINGGHIAPYCDGNYGEAITRAKRVKAWTYPTLRIELPDPARDERIASVIKREIARAEILAARKANGLVTTQDDADNIADDLELRKATLANPEARTGEIREYHITNKIVAPDQALASLGLPPMPDGIGSVARLAEERRAGKDQAGKAASAVDPAAPSADPLDDGEAVPGAPAAGQSEGA